VTDGSRYNHALGDYLVLGFAGTEGDDHLGNLRGIGRIRKAIANPLMDDRCEVRGEMLFAQAPMGNEP